MVKSKVIFVFAALIAAFGFSRQAAASYLVVAPGGYADVYTSCVRSSDGSLGSSAASMDCVATIPIPVEAGKTLGSITFYYYDSSSTQSIAAYLKYVSLSSTAAATTLASFGDTSTSSSIQSYTLSYGSALSSSYVYFLYVDLDYGTELTAIKFYYY